MLATLVHDLPPQPRRWGFEYKWDGVRALYYWDGQSVRIESRNGLRITHRYPELVGLATALGRQRVVLDGEIVALDERGRPSFQQLTRRMHVEGEARIQRVAVQVPICYLIFDLLHLNSLSTFDLGYLQRRRLLDGLRLDGPAWQVSPMYAGRGAAMLESARQQGLEGIVAKRLDSPYEPGRRSPNWLKLKVVARQEFVIGGWTPQRGMNQRVGSLLLGYYDTQGALRLAGAVGTGFDDRWHSQLTRQLQAIGRPQSPFADPVRKPARFVEPRLVAEVEYRRWPSGQSVQQASFKGIRQDKHARDVVDERPGGS